MMKYQRGFELSRLIYWGIALSLVALLGMKVVPSVMEYYKTVSAIKKTVGNVSPGASVPDVRKAYDKFAEIDQLEMKAADLDISKDGGNIVISFAYDKKIPLFGPASLLIEYRGSSKD